MELLDFSCFKTGERRLDVLQKLQKYDLPVVIYGTGRFARSAAEFLQDNDVRIECFVDKDMYWHEGKRVSISYREYPCQNIEGNFSIFEDYVVVYGFNDATEFEDSKQHFVGCKDFVYIDGYRGHWMSDKFLQVHQSILKNLYDSLKDEESKRVMKAYLYARYTGDIWPLGDLRQDCSYDWKLLAIDQQDVFLDGGAYTGDTIAELIDSGGVRRILAFEPDAKNLVKLLRSCSADILARVNVYPYALWSKDTVMCFDEIGTVASSVSDEGKTEVKTLSLDNHECFSDVSVVKMDIEGSELEALRGMYRLIKQNKPRLAIRVYHNNKDIVEIFLFLKQFGYDFYLRQHAFSVEETTLYAI